MKRTRDLFVLWKDVVMVRVKAMVIRDNERVARVVFDNGEEAVVPCAELKMSFDLESDL